MFDIFANMTPAERQTTDPNGEVAYDPVIAAESEKRKGLNLISNATSSTNGNNGLTTLANCRSAAAKALLAFEKKIKPNEGSWAKFESQER